MSRSYRTLAAALVAMLVLVGIAQLVKSDDAQGSVAGPSAASTVIDAGTVPSSDSTQPVTDVVDGDAATTSSLAPPITADCTITEVLKVGASGTQVQCLESQLAAAGFPTTVDTDFDAATDTAVKAYQTAKSLEVDGIVGRVTAQTMGIWAGPLGPMPATNDDCPSTPHGVIVDRANQRGALCENGSITYEFPITTAVSQPDPGTYPVYAKDLNASSTITGQYSTMTHFVAFTRGKYQGARIAFHSMPKYSNGQYLQPLDSVGTPEMHGESSGCIRLKPDDAIRVWDWLAIDDEVHVIS
jgi:peptidoglycan hydrolase-like protein with peptidoglycan-binding domain